MSGGAAATSAENTLNKASAHLRWLIEKSGVDPEKVSVCLVVAGAAERDRIEATIRHREFDPARMTASGEWVVANGVRIAVVTKKEAA